VHVVIPENRGHFPSTRFHNNVPNLNKGPKQFLAPSSLLLSFPSLLCNALNDPLVEDDSASLVLNWDPYLQFNALATLLVD